MDFMCETESNGLPIALTLKVQMRIGGWGRGWGRGWVN